VGLREWFGGGPPKPPQVDALLPEGVIHAEVARGSLIYRNYRSPRRYSSYRSEPALWTLAVTRVRLHVQRRGMPAVNVPWADPRVHALEIVADDKVLHIHADVAQYDRTATGTAEVRIRVGDPRAVRELIDSMRRRVS
jgi:hypothetical protein